MLLLPFDLAALEVVFEAVDEDGGDGERTQGVEENRPLTGFEGHVRA